MVFPQNAGGDGVSTRARAALSDMTNKNGGRAGATGKAVRRAGLHARRSVAQSSASVPAPLRCAMPCPRARLQLG